MPVITLDNSNFPSTVAESATLLINVWASGNEPCRRFEPVFAACAEKCPQVRFARLDADAHPDICLAFNIEHVPTLMIFRESIIVYLEAGALSADVLEALIERVASLDMDAVRAEIVESPSSGGGQGIGRA